MNIPSHYTVASPVLGDIDFLPFNLKQDLSPLCDWVKQDYAHFWGMGHQSDSEIQNFYQQLANASDQGAVVGWINGNQAFVIEVYNPAKHDIRHQYEHKVGDMGMHLLLAPAEVPQSGFSRAVIASVAEYLFNALNAQRIVVEPDIHNHKIHKLNLAVGFHHLKPITLGDKRALLGLLDKQRFEQLKHSHSALHSSQQLKGHQDPYQACASQLQLRHWQQANRGLVRKMLCEFSHERLLIPNESSQGEFYLASADNKVLYQFSASPLPLDHLSIELSSLRKFISHEPQPLDAMAFILEFATELGLSGELLATYLEEISSTLTSSCYKLDKSTCTAEQLTGEDFQVVETEMTEGHPTFVANNGRIGFDCEDYHQYAPEAANTLQLVWLAAHRSNTAFHCIDELSYQQVIEQELDLSERLYFDSELTLLGHDPRDYYLFPMHPWQWQNKLVHLYAREIAQGKLLCLGRGQDRYLPQQSVRTLYNLTSPQRYYVKTALSILNMGFMRGLSAAYMAVTPAINQWLFRLISHDATLTKLNFVPLQELATLGFTGSHYEDPQLGSTQYSKMLSALWRENPVNLIEQHESLATMASLLHVDRDGRAYLTAKIQRSCVNAKTWITQYLRCYLTLSDPHFLISL